ncbi:hypothetical protein [Caulobacter sp. CCH9-E1]|uniref:hypothetical protein n=1 Tax=Caulobacter sp. CCH9-E1 TaxID=1768768 RepID=UPI000AACA1EE|nr:hypothetical protein [Caulobacter sp. CCH9-E1]
MVVKMRFDDRAPDSPQLTSYDEGHLADYLRLLDADADVYVVRSFETAGLRI